MGGLLQTTALQSDLQEIFSLNLRALSLGSRRLSRSSQQIIISTFSKMLAARVAKQPQEVGLVMDGQPRQVRVLLALRVVLVRHRLGERQAMLSKCDCEPMLLRLRSARRRV